MCERERERERGGGEGGREGERKRESERERQRGGREMVISQNMHLFHNSSLTCELFDEVRCICVRADDREG